MTNGTILIIKDGILHEITNSEEEKKELDKKNWDYRMTTKSGRFTVIDYDKDQARPYVKALLAKVNRLREVKLLYFTLLLLSIVWITSVIGFIVVTMKESDVMKSVLARPAPANTVNTVLQSAIPESIKKTISVPANSDTESIDTFQSSTGTQQVSKPTNHLFR